MKKIDIGEWVFRVLACSVAALIIFTTWNAAYNAGAKAHARGDVVAQTLADGSVVVVVPKKEDRK
jgi:hypothetical protein